MNKTILAVFVLALATVALAGRKRLACDDQVGAGTCRTRASVCKANIEHNYTNETSPEYLHETCPCILEHADCLERIECNGSDMWNVMVLCNGVPNCTNCSFFASASTVLPAFVLVAAAVLFAVFF